MSSDWFPNTPYTVSYNGQQPWGGGAPYVSMEVEEVFEAGQIGMIRTITLNGTVPTSGTSVITGIKSAFASNFQTFSAPNVSMPFALVQEVTFGSQNYIGKVDYTIVLKDFTGFLFGVTDPVDEISFQEEGDGSVTINHKVSALGISTALTAANAFSNAVAFVQGRTGIANLGSIGTSFVPQGFSGNLYCVSQQENINRAAGSYSINESFKYDPLHSTSGIALRRFSVDFNSGISDDYMQVIVNGTYLFGKDTWDTSVYNQVISDELFIVALQTCNTISNPPIAFSVEAQEVSQTAGGTQYPRVLNARATYDNSPNISYFDYETEGARDFKNGLTQINVKGMIVGSGRHVRRKFDSALSFYNSIVGSWDGVKGFLYRAAQSGANDFSYTNFPLNTIPKSVSVTFNSGQGSIAINASFDDAPFVPGYFDFIWSVNSDCGLNVFKPFASANKNGSYLIQDLNILNRTSVILNGNFAFPVTGTFDTSKADNLLVLLRGLEGANNAFVEGETYNSSSGEDLKSGFNYSYTKDGSNLSVLPYNGKIYAGISL